MGKNPLVSKGQLVYVPKIKRTVKLSIRAC